MNNPKLQLRQAYFERLNGNVVIDESPITVFNTNLPATVPNYYIILSSQTGSQQQGKCKCLREHTLLIDVVTKFNPFEGNADISDEIIDQISVLVNNETPLDLGPNFACMNVVEESSTDGPSIETNNETIIRKLIRFRHLIKIK